MSDDEQGIDSAESPATRDKKPRGGTVRLTLNTVTNSRLTLGRLMRARVAGKIDRELFRDLCYGFEKQLQYWKLEADLRIEGRLDAIEAKLEDLA